MKKLIEKVKGAATVGYLTFVPSDFDIVSPDKGAETDPKQATVDIINYVLFFVGVIAVVFIVWGGIQFMMAGGDAEKVTKAKNTLLYAILGIVVVVLAFAIVNWAKALV